MLLNQFLLLAAILFSIGVYGVIVRKNGVLVLMSIELILNAVNINLIAFATFWGMGGQVFALFVIAVAAAEVGVAPAHSGTQRTPARIELSGLGSVSRARKVRLAASTILSTRSTVAALRTAPG